MTEKTVIYLWNNACRDVIGVDGEGQEVYRLTAFGLIAMGSDVPTTLDHRDVSSQQKAAEFLEAWAEALRKAKNDD
jgi:hypothetical protein